MIAMEKITQVVAYELNGQNMGVYRWGCDWIFLKENLITGEIKGNLCLCFEQASDLMDACVEKTKIWIN